ASICEGRFLDGATDDDIERRFVDARNADYAELAAAARQLAKKAAAKRSSQEALAGEHAKLAARFGEVVAIDFLGAPGREAAEGLLASVARALPRDGTAAQESLE